MGRNHEGIGPSVGEKRLGEKNTALLPVYHMRGRPICYVTLSAFRSKLLEHKTEKGLPRAELQTQINNKKFASCLE